MKNKTTTYKWAYLPFVFSSAAILATQATAGPSGNQRYQDARQVSSINHEYVGGKTQIGVGVDDEGNFDAEFNQVISESDSHSTGVGLWAGYDLKGDDKGVLGRGGQVNHAWVSRDAEGRAKHVNKTFVAYDRNEVGHDKATIGYGQENEHLFWDGRVSKGLSGGKDKRTVGGKVVTDRAYDWGVGASVGKFLPGANARIRAGVDHEWSNKVGSGEKNAQNTTLSAGIEKFFQGTGHSLSLDVAGSKNSGGYRFDNQDDTDFSGRLGYKFDFGGSSIYQPDRRYRRVRVEVPGQAVAPRYAQKQQYKKVPTYKTVPVYGNKTIRTPTKQLVKSTMELEGQTFFKLNSAKLIPSAQTRLKQIAAQIKKTGYKGSIRITGNTCGLGNARYDQILSEKRAKEVRNFLIKNGFNPNHLIARGLGKGHPKYPRTPDQDFKNRRVDIEYVSQQQSVKTGYKTENRRVQTGTRQVATGFKNVPAGMKNVMISNGRPGAPRVIWKTEAIPTSPAWIKRALHNNIKHDRGVNTYTTTFGNETRVTENTAPVASNDSGKTKCGAPVSINVLGNDRDADGDTLTITSFTQPANGSVTRGDNGDLIYTPNATTACGTTDSFTYTVSDGNGGTSTADVTVDVEAAVDDVVNAENDTASTNEGEPVAINVLNNDDSDASITRIVSGPTNGSAEIIGGQIIYTPVDGFTGTDSFVYEVRDPNGNIATATATITVIGATNTAPVAVSDSTQTQCGNPVTINVLGNDTDADTDALTITSFTQPTNGTVTRGANGQLIYTPNSTEACGIDDSFTYTISDGNGGTSTGDVTVTVDPAEDNDVKAANDSATTDEGEAVTINVLGNDDADATITRVVTAPGNGSATIVDGQIVYTPNAGFSGEDTFTYEVTDPQGNKTTATVTVTVNDVDNDVKAANDSATTDEGEAVTINVLGNDDADATITRVVTAPGNGSATIVDGQIVYTPNAGFSGEDTFTYEVQDPQGNKTTATVTVTVNPLNNDVKAANDSATTDEGEAVTINVLGNDDSDATITRVVTAPGNGSATIVNGQIVYTPNAGFTGEDTFTYEVQDPQGNKTTATVVVTVNPIDDDVKAANDTAMTDEGEAVTIDVLGNDDADAAITRIVSAPSNGSATIVNGQIVYNPNAGFSGTDTFTYEVQDPQGNKTTATVTVTVKPVDDDVKAGNDSATTNEGEAVTINVLGNDDADASITRVVSSPANGSATIVNGQIVYNPNAGFSGTDTFTYEVTDPNGNTTTATVTVTVKGDVKAANDSVTTGEDQPVTIDVLNNDDTDATLTRVVTGPSNGTATISGGQIVYAPNAGFSGTDTFTYEVTDPNGNTTTATVTVIVKGDVKASNDSATTDQDESITIDVLSNDDSDATLTRVVTGPSNGSATISGGQIVYTPNAGFSGTDTFTYEVSDPQGNLTTAMVTVTVLDGKPTAKNDSVATQCSPISIDVLGNDDGDNLDVISVNADNLMYGTIMQSGNQITYSPSNTCGKGNTGVDNFSYTIRDGNGNEDSANVKVTVKGITSGGGTKANMDDAMISTGETITLDVLANDKGKGLRIINVGQPANGKVTWTGSQVTYTATGSGTYTDEFWYDIVDANGYNDAAVIMIDVIKGCPIGMKCN